MKVLIVLTSHDRLGDTGQPTGFWLEEFAAPYYRLRDAGFTVTLASPAGGRPPVDPKSEAEDFRTDATRRFEDDPEAQAQLDDTVPLSEVDVDLFDAVFYPGGHGPLWDLVDDEHSIRLLERYRAENKPIAAVCHAPAVLTHASSEGGKPLVAGRRVTGFTNGEEAAVELTDVVPFLLEDRLRELGATYERGDDWAPHVVVDGRLVTGQNPASSAPAADALIELLRGDAR